MDHLWDAVVVGDHAGALDLHGRLLALWNRSSIDLYVNN